MSVDSFGIPAPHSAARPSPKPPSTRTGTKNSAIARQFVASHFIQERIRQLLARFTISCLPEESCIEYFISNPKNNEGISFSLVLAHNRYSRQIHVSKFYPGLNRQPNCKNLSAAAFFLLIQHFAQHFQLGSDQTIYLQCRQEVFTTFYAKLRDFRFRPVSEGSGDNINIASPMPLAELDISMIRNHSTAQTD